MSRRFVAAAALLLAGFGPAGDADDDPDCALRPGAIQEVWSRPAPARPLGDAPVLLAEGAVVAEEAFLVRTRKWSLAAPFKPVRQIRFAYPRGETVALASTPAGELQCFLEAALALRGPRARQGIVHCLIDGDQDGRHETLGALDMARGTLRKTTLATPVLLLADDRPGSGDFTAVRRVRVANFNGRSVRLVVEHGREQAGRAGAFLPHPDSARAIALVHGGVETVGGLRLRVERTSAGWTMTPLDPAFPGWIRFQCGAGG